MKRKVVSLMLAGMIAVAPVATTVATPIMAYADILETTENIDRTTVDITKNSEGVTITINTNVVTENDGVITNNQNTVTDNDGTIVNNTGTFNSEGQIVTPAVVETNDSTGTVQHNMGTININKGEVEHNSGTINDNSEGTVQYNQAGGTVVGGTVDCNWGSVSGDATVNKNFSGLGATVASGVNVIHDYFAVTMGDNSRWLASTTDGNSYTSHLSASGEETRLVDKNGAVNIHAYHSDLEYLSNVEVGTGTATITQVSEGVWKLSGITGNVTLIPTYVARIIQEVINTPVKEDATVIEKEEKAEEIKIVEEFIASTPNFTEEEAAAVVEQVIAVRQEAVKQAEAQAIQQATAEVKVEDIKVAAVDESGKKLAVAVAEMPVVAAKNQMVSACTEIKQAISGNKEAMKVFTEAGIDVSKIDTTKAKVVSSAAIAMPKEGTITLDIAKNTIKATDTVLAVFTDSKGRRYYAPIKINKDGTITVKIPVKNCSMSLIKF